MKHYNAIDVARIIAAILVICIHTDPLESYPGTGNYFLVSVLARLAVPFFFVASGFFFGKKLRATAVENHLSILGNVTRRLIFLYILWTLIYLPLQIFIWLRNGGTWSYWITYLQKFLFEGSYYTLWYLSGLIFAIAFSYLLFKVFKPEQVLMITFVLYSIGTLLQTYYDLIPAENFLSWYYAVFLTTRNGLFFGSFFVSLGIYIAYSKRAFRPKWNVRFLILSFLLLALEAFYMKASAFTKGNGMWFMLVPTVFFLFKVLQSIQLRNRPIYQLLRPFSFLLYVTHGLFLIGFAVLFKINSLLYFGIVLFFTCLLSLCIMLASSKYNLFKRLF